MSLYPRVAEYLSTLPLGSASYPECRVKGAVIRQFIDGPMCDLMRVPSEISAFLRSPPITSAWASESYFNVAMLSLMESRGMTEDDFVSWAHQRNASLLRGPIYGIVMLFASPELLLRKGASRWATFHLGTTVQLREPSPGGGTLTMTFPRFLFPRVILRAYATAFQAAIEAANGKDVRAQLVQDLPTQATFRVTWKGSRQQ